MKTIFPPSLLLASVLLASLFLGLSGCKYEDGPLVSLRSKRVRLEGTKKVVKYTVDGVDNTAAINACYVSSSDYNRAGFDIYYNDEGYDMYCHLCGSGRFIYVDEHKKTEVFINLPAGPECDPQISKLRWEITKLTNQEFHLKQTSNGILYELWLDVIQ